MNLYKLTIDHIDNDYKSYEAYCVASNPAEAQRTIMAYADERYDSNIVFISSIAHIAQVGRDTEYKTNLPPLFLTL